MFYLRQKISFGTTTLTVLSSQTLSVITIRSQFNSNTVELFSVEIDYVNKEIGNGCSVLMKNCRLA